MEHYLALHYGFEHAFSFLRDTDFDRVHAGCIEIVEGRVYAMLSGSQGKGKEGATLEAHRAFFDVQFTVRRCDVVGWRDLQSCRHQKAKFDFEYDVVFLTTYP